MLRRQGLNGREDGGGGNCSVGIGAATFITDDASFGTIEKWDFFYFIILN